MITIFNFFRYLIMYIRYMVILLPIYRQEELPENLSKLFGSPFNIDWIGRMYAVVNPFIDEEGNFDASMVVTELGSDLPSPIVVEKFIMDRLNVAQQFIQASNIFDLVTYKIEKIDGYYNYLFVMSPLPFNELKKWAKRFVWVFPIMAILVTVALIIFL